MVEAGATLPQRAAAKRGYSSWHRGDASFVDRFRKPIVAGSLICGDVVAAIAAISLSRGLMEIAGTEPPDRKHLSIAFLIVAFFCAHLYTGCGPSPYERFRLRTIGITAFIAIDVGIGFSAGQPGALFVVGLCEALSLLIFGHYVEAMIRTLLVRLDLWGASTALVGCGDDSQKLAHLLMHQPALGLMPIGFVETPSDCTSRTSMLPLPLLGATAKLGSIRPHVEFAICNSLRLRDIARSSWTTEQR
jgi:hypothetical protein